MDRPVKNLVERITPTLVVLIVVGAPNAWGVGCQHIRHVLANLILSDPVLLRVFPGKKHQPSPELARVFDYLQSIGSHGTPFEILSHTADEGYGIAGIRSFLGVSVHTLPKDGPLKTIMMSKPFQSLKQHNVLFLLGSLSPEYRNIQNQAFVILNAKRGSDIEALLWMDLDAISAIAFQHEWKHIHDLVINLAAYVEHLPPMPAPIINALRLPKTRDTQSLHRQIETTFRSLTEVRAVDHTFRWIVSPSGLWYVLKRFGVPNEHFEILLQALNGFHQSNP